MTIFPKVKGSQEESVPCEACLGLAPGTYFWVSLRGFPALGFPTPNLLPVNGTDLVGSAVEPGNLQGTFQVTEARLAQVLDDSVTQGRNTGAQRCPGVLQGCCRDTKVEFSRFVRPGCGFHFRHCHYLEGVQ